MRNLPWIACLLVCGSACAESTPPPAPLPQLTFEQQKQSILDGIDRGPPRLQAQRTCVAQAQNLEQLRLCHP